MDDLTVEQIGNSWVFSDGTTLPVVSGGSDLPPEQDAAPWDSDPDLSDYARQFIPNVPDEHKPIVYEHIKNWDNGYKSQVERLKGQYEPELNNYKQLGTPQSLQQEVAIARAFAADPTGVMRRALEGGYGDKEALRDLFAEAVEAQGGTPQQQVDFTQHEKWKTLENGMGAIANWIQSQEQQRNAQAQESALNQTLEGIKAQAPGIDDTYALSIAYAMMKDGKPVDQQAIVNQWNSLRNGILGQNRSPKPPATMPGAGAPSSSAKDLKTMSPEQRVQFLTQALQGNQT